jgi:hypothetical protein
MVWPLATRLWVVTLATPPLTLTGFPKFVPSSWNCTSPVGVPAPGAETLMEAVMVTLCPNTEGLADEATAVLVAALLTLGVSVPVLPLKVLSPL